MSAITLVNSDTTLDFGWETYLIDATNNNITLTAPLINNDGDYFYSVRIDASANTVTLQGTAGQLINGQNSVTYSAKQNINIISFQNNWYIFSS
jgi:hypothetical protein